jgi:hypothetical protein
MFQKGLKMFDEFRINSLVVETSVKPSKVGIIASRIGTVCQVHFLDGSKKPIPTIYLRKVGTSTFEMFLGETKEVTYHSVSVWLEECLNNNPQKGFTVDDIKRQSAVWQGDDYEPHNNWYWILELISGEFAFLQSTIQYGGFWDVITSSSLHPTEKFAAQEIYKYKIADIDPEYADKIYYCLLAQVNSGNVESWQDALIAAYNSVKDSE